MEANLQLGFAPDERSYEDCVAILHALGIRQIRLLSNNPQKIAALRKAGLEIVERVPLEVEPREETVAYLRAKKEKLGHLLSSV
ncbi:GTP cyclohydrolase-2 [bacterium HR10]|nr:GTP cyclohydrolase-2 [bacterium HR10]